MVIRRGYVVAEWGEPDRVDPTFSVAESVLSTVAALAVAEGRIALDEPVWRSQAPVTVLGDVGPGADPAALGRLTTVDLFPGGHNRRITWDHLLRQTSDWHGELWGKPDWADRPDRDPETWLTRPRATPGTVWEYNDTRVNVLAMALLNVYRQPLPAVLRDRVMDPIGASPTWRWHGYRTSWVLLDGQPVQSVSGGTHWGGGLWVSVWDQARFGLLTLRRGRWGDRQVVPDGWFTTARTPTPANPGYGVMNYFLNETQELFPERPDNGLRSPGRWDEPGLRRPRERRRRCRPLDQARRPGRPGRTRPCLHHGLAGPVRRPTGGSARRAGERESGRE